MVWILHLAFALPLIFQAYCRKIGGGDLAPIPIRSPRKLPRAIWGHWTSYGPCSRSCGQGVKMRSRDCLQWSGDRYSQTHLTACEGSNIDYKICNFGNCSRTDEDFRAYQCRILSKTRPVTGNIHMWKPYDGGKVCELHCKVVDQPIFYKFGTVQDGTPCHAHLDHVCVHGQCLMIGCDGHVGVGTRMDMCGVCNGRNDTCSHIRATYQTKLPSEHTGYNRIVTIPRGARHFKIQEASRNSLALMDVHRRYVLNGHYKMDMGGNYSVGGTSLTYHTEGRGYEAIQGEGPVKQDFHVMLLYRQENTGVNYEYWLPKKSQHTKAYSGFDNAIPVGDDTSGTSARASDVTSPPFSKNTTQSDDKVWDMVMKEIENERKGIKKYRNDRQHIEEKGKTKKTRSESPRKAKKTRLDKTENTTKNRFDKTRKKKKGRKQKKTKLKKRRKFLRKDQCAPCRKRKDRNKQFCHSDFVSKVRINGVEAFGNSTRYDVSILYTYRNIVPLLHREYLWVNNICKCPRLRLRKDYVIMGMTRYHGAREIRLSVSPESYVRPFSYKHHVRLHKLKRKRSKCKVKKKIFR